MINVSLSLEIIQPNNIKLYIPQKQSSLSNIFTQYRYLWAQMPNYKCRLSTREKQNKHKVDICTAIIQYTLKYSKCLTFYSTIHIKSITVICWNKFSTSRKYKFEYKYHRLMFIWNTNKTWLPHWMATLHLLSLSQTHWTLDNRQITLILHKTLNIMEPNKSEIMRYNMR